MGILGADIEFSTAPPTVPALVVALCHYTGELVTYDDKEWKLACEATGDAFGFCANPNEQERRWELLNLNLKGGYLWFATLVVLQQLGGTCDWKIPSWEFMPWVQAKREFKRLFVRRRSYTYDEARRLGIVK